MTPSGFDALGKIRPTEEELKTMSPGFDQRWKTFFADYADKPVVAIATAAGYVDLWPRKVQHKFIYLFSYFGKVPNFPIGKYFATCAIMVGVINDKRRSTSMILFFRRTRKEPDTFISLRALTHMESPTFIRDTWTSTEIDVVSTNCVS